jgi:ATP-binding cassette, subfamily C, bacterial CydD
MINHRLIELVREQLRTLSLVILLGIAGCVLLIWQSSALSNAIALPFLHHKTLAGVSGWIALLLMLAIGRSVLVWGGEIASRIFAARLRVTLRDRLFAHLLALGPGFVRGERSGELAITATQGIDDMDDYFSQFLPQIFLAVLLPLIIVIAIAPIDTLSAIILAITAPLIPIFMILVGSLSASLAQKQWETLSRMGAHFLDVIQGLTTLILFNRARYQEMTIAKISDDFRKATLRVLRVAFLSALVLELLATISTAVIAVEIGLRLLYGQISFERAFFVLLLAPEFYLPLRKLGVKFHAASTGKASSERIFKVLDLPIPRSGSGTISLPSQPFSIAFEHVTYTYPGRERPALEDASFTLSPGKRIALVGLSGAGKSTVANLLLRFMEPDSGMIRVDDTPLRDIVAADWRKQVGWAAATPYLFHGTIADNLRMAGEDATTTDMEIACRLAEAHDFISALPQGYDTVIGERGARLSGGQIQRIALARAFLRNAPLLILDEATSSVDLRVDAKLQSNITSLAHKRVVLLVAHRIPTIIQADEIIVIEHGRVVGDGKHAELLACCPAYQRLLMAYTEEATA